MRPIHLVNLLGCALLIAMAFVAERPSPASAEQIPDWGTTYDPDKDCRFVRVQDELTIIVPGKDHDLGIERGKMNAPRVLRPVPGDFIVEVRVAGQFAPGEPDTKDRAPFHGAGLLLLADNRNYVRLERATFHRGGPPIHFTVFEVRKNGENERFAQSDDYPLQPGRDTYLRLERRGGTVYAAITQEKDNWHSLTPRQVKWPTEVKVGVAAVNTSKAEFAPRFYELKLLGAKR